LREAKRELGKAFLNLANMILVLFLFNTYLQKENINIPFVFFTLYGIGGLYYLGYSLIKENSNEQL